MKHNLYNKFANNIKAYTIAEMSIVLLIIALITAGVMGGINYIEQARLSKIASELNMYRTAVKSFIDKYQAIPGDMPNASSTISSTATNGDGNEQITTNSETLIVWQHLNLAGFLSKTYTASTADVVLPKGPVEGSYYAIRTSDINGIIKTYVEFGGISNTARGFADVSILTPTQALTVDRKIDDGVATTGNVLGITGLAPITFTSLTSTDCADTSLTAASKYNMTNANLVVCKLVYLID